MDHRIVERLRAAQPRLLAWDDLVVRTLKDPQRPLSAVSDLGVPHGGMEKDSAVYRISDGQRSFIVKRHFDPTTFRREVANITFVNEAGRFAPEIVWSDGETGTILMEDLGDRSLAWLWKAGRMDDYETWVYEVVEATLQVQAHFHQHGRRLRALYGGLSFESPPSVGSPGELVANLSEALWISRGTRLEEKDRKALLRAAAAMSGRVERFNADHREFVLGLTPWHVFEKEGRIRVIDLTFPPVGSILRQFENMTWHLQTRRNVWRFYLSGRDSLGLPPADHEEFRLLTDWLHVLGCILWIRIYARDILEGEQTLVDLRGQKLTDYRANESANLNAIHRAIGPHAALAVIGEVLERHFARPLLEE